MMYWLKKTWAPAGMLYGPRWISRVDMRPMAQAGGMGPPWAYELWVLRKDLRRARETLDLPEARDG